MQEISFSRILIMFIYEISAFFKIEIIFSSYVVLD